MPYFTALGSNNFLSIRDSDYRLYTNSLININTGEADHPVNLLTPMIHYNS